MLKWMRKRMRKMLWVVAIIAAVSFGITGVMVSVLQRWSARQIIAYVMGNPIKSTEAETERNLLDRMGGVFGTGVVRAADVTYPPLSGEEKRDMLYAQIMVLALAEKEGVAIPKAKVVEKLRNWYRFKRLRDLLYERAGDKDWRLLWFRMSPQERERLFEQINEEFKSLVGRYLRRAHLDWGTFQAMADRLALFEFYLRGLPNRLAWTPPSETYTRFRQKYHKRRLAAVWLPSKDFKFAAEVCVNEKSLRDFYEKVKPDYQVPQQVVLQCVMLTNDIAAKLVKQPDEKALKHFYEALKFQPPIWDDKRKSPRPFKEVKQIVLQRYIKSHAQEEAHKKMEKLLTRINEIWRRGKEFEKLLKKEKLIQFDTEAASEDDFLKKNANHFGDSPKAKVLIWDKIAIEEEPELKRKFFGPVGCEKGVFIWRLKSVAKKRFKPFQEVYEEIKKRWVENEASRIAEKAMKDIANHLRQVGRVPDSFLLERSLPVIETDFIGRYDRIKELEWGRELVSVGFELEKTGDVSKPQKATTKKEGEIWFVVIYLARKEPDSSDFKKYRRSLERPWEKAKEWAEEWWEITVKKFTPVDREGKPLIGRKEEREPEIPPELEK